MRAKKTVNVELDIGELTGLIDYCTKMADSIPKHLYDTPTRSGGTFGEAVKSYRDRADELYELLDRIWPK